MSAFLIGTLFDDYSLIEAQITTFCTFSIDGRYERLFEADRSAEGNGADEDAGGPVEYVRWEQVRERCLSVIRGKRTPLFFKFVFFYPKEQIGAFLRDAGTTVTPEQIAGLCLNLRFDGANLVLTTGTSMNVFSMDRTVDRAWDEHIRQLLISQNILTSDV